jgi:hypothetical protein
MTESSGITGKPTGLSQVSHRHLTPTLGTTCFSTCPGRWRRGRLPATYEVAVATGLACRRSPRRRRGCHGRAHTCVCHGPTRARRPAASDLCERPLGQDPTGRSPCPGTAQYRPGQAHGLRLNTGAECLLVSVGRARPRRTVDLSHAPEVPHIRGQSRFVDRRADLLFQSGEGTAVAVIL